MPPNNSSPNSPWERNLVKIGFRISDPPSRQGTKMDICSWLLKYSEFLIPITARDKNDHLFMLVKVFRISDPPSNVKEKQR